MIETREVSITEDSYGYGKWQTAIRHKSTNIYFLNELKKAVSDLMSLNEQTKKKHLIMGSTDIGSIMTGIPSGIPSAQHVPTGFSQPYLFQPLASPLLLA